VKAEPVGFCPCGIVDASGGSPQVPYYMSIKEESKESEENNIINSQVELSQLTLFDSDGRPSYDYDNVGNGNSPEYFN